MTDDNPRMYMGEGTKVYLLPLRHRNQISFDITALYPDGTWAPEITTEDLVKTVEGFDERIVQHRPGLDLDTVNIRAVYDIDPVDTWHTDSVVAARRCRPLDAAPPGPGRELGHRGRRRPRRRTCRRPARSRRRWPSTRPTRKPVTDELQRISRLGWTEDGSTTSSPVRSPRPSGHDQ